MNTYSLLRKEKFGMKTTNYNPRLIYILQIQAHTPSVCPECNNTLTVDDEQIYCPVCGLITQDSYDFHAGEKFHLPHGIRLG